MPQIVQETPRVADASDKKPKFLIRFDERREYLHRLLTHIAVDRRVSLNALTLDVLEEWALRQPEAARYAPDKSRGE